MDIAAHSRWFTPIAAALAALVALVPGLALVTARPAHAADLPTITETVSDEGFKHPGGSITAADLENAQTQVNAGVEPWASYYDAMSQTGFAATDFTGQNQGDDDQPKNDAYDQAGIRGMALNDSRGALTQALMYTMTGDPVYRANALHILRTWSNMDPEKYTYFPDAHIHTAEPLYHFVTAAEILQATSTDQDELDGYSLLWSDEDQQNAEDNMVTPTLDTFLSSQNRLWNQHTYGLVGSIAGAIFLDDTDLYDQRVEWFTVNSTYESEHPYINGGDVNGGLTSLIREIDTDDPLNPYGESFVQLMEIERDQAHAEGDLTTFSGIARMVNNQGTTVDPENGTVSTADDAVSPYAFADDRLLHGADMWIEYMMGGSPEFIDPTGGASTLAEGYRGRLHDMMNDLYYQYTYVEGVDVEKEAPYVAKLFEESDGPLYYNGSGIENFWDLRGSDFTDAEYWVSFPAELADQDVQVPQPAESADVSPVKYGYSLGKGATLLTDDDGTDVARLDASADDAQFAVRRLGFGGNDEKSLVAIPVRTDGTATLRVSATADSDPIADLTLPDTGGEWTIVWVDLKAAAEEGRPIGSNIMFLQAQDGDARVEVGSIRADATETITPPTFADEPSLSVTAVAGEEYSRSLSGGGNGKDVTYSLQGAPKGAKVSEDGTLTWTPTKRQKSADILVVATDGEATTTLPVHLDVAMDRHQAINSQLDGLEDSEKYTTESWDAVDQARTAAENNSGEESATFAGLLEDLRLAVDDLVLVNPQLEDGTLDYSRIVTSDQITSTAGFLALTDGSNATTWGDMKVENPVVIDFGAGFRVSADRFGLLARDTFPNRSEGTNVYGSNDGKEWTLLTVSPNTGDDDEIEYLDVQDSQKDVRWRYLKLQADEPGPPTDPAYPGIWTQADLRIDGARSEITLDEALDDADARDTSDYSRASVVLYERELAAVKAAAEEPDTDEKALVQRVLAAQDLLEEPTATTAELQQDWVTASSESFDGTKDAAANGWSLFDGDTATFTDTTTADGWVTVVPDDDSELTVSAVRYVPRAGYTSRADGVEFQSSDNGGETWKTFATASGSKDDWNQITLEEPVTTKAIRVTSDSGYTNLAEVQFLSSSTDTSALKLHLDEATALTESDWTPESWAALEEERAAAEAVLADADFTQEEIDAAADALAEAVSGLEVDHQDPVVTTATSTRCVKGDVVLVVSVTNGGTDVVDVTVTGRFGTKSVQGLAPGKTAAIAFSTRDDAIKAGKVTVTATDASGASTTDKVKYAASSCGCLHRW